MLKLAMRNIILLLSILPLTLFAMSNKGVPDNSEKAKNHMGWKCKKGFIQKRNKCIELKLPSHATLNSDGNTWSCDTGYVKYRNVCKSK
jgi:hypothetical protein